jgi:N-acetylmuramoyl-L-alanine amidase
LHAKNYAKNFSYRVLAWLSATTLLLIVLSGCSSPRTKITESSTITAPSVKKASAEAQPIAETSVEPIRKTRKWIVIDAGHGGNDHGTQSLTKPHLIEKNLNLTTAQLVDTFLRQMGYQTIMTRRNDHFVTLDKRSEIANAKKCDLFVSIHYNSAPNKQAHGIEVFYYQDKAHSSRSTQSKLLAQKVLAEVIHSNDARSRGVKHGNLAVIRETKMPAILIEGGFLTNSGETDKLRDKDYIRELAWGIAKGIQEYINRR